MRSTISMLSIAGLVLTGVLTADFASAQQCDIVTGGGFIVFDNGAHGNFGVGGGCKHGSPTWGHLEFVDHGSGLDPTTPFNVHGTDVTGYFFIDPTTRDISGTARTNDPSHPDVNYCVEVSDNDPGTTDTFKIQLTDTNSTTPFYPIPPPTDPTLHGGDIELHKANPSTTGSFSGSTTCLVSTSTCEGTTSSCGSNGVCMACNPTQADRCTAGACTCGMGPACPFPLTCTNGSCAF